MKLQAWIGVVALALALTSVEAAAQGTQARRGPTPVVTSQARKPVVKREVPESSLGSAERRALLGGKTSASRKGALPTGKPAAKT